jgi:coniferyl-aldehyde dehydrogenase
MMFWNISTGRNVRLPYTCLRTIKNYSKEYLHKQFQGGVIINDCAIHVAQHDMPFGGVGNSGMGHYHGHEGFIEMSKMKPVFKQSWLVIPLSPPYGKFLDRIYNLVKKLKWLN